ncbi:MAG: hypothetical protein RR885_00790 [Oscillospiraceae bacterium]
MRKLLSAIILAFAITLLCSCAPVHEPMNTLAQTPPPSEIPSVPSPMEPVNAPKSVTAETFLSFLSENYEALSASCFGGIAGIGFIDLDLGGEIEMLLFDAGASSSMCVQIYDIINGTVECISSSTPITTEGSEQKYLSKISINVGCLEDFRLVEQKSTGERFFCVESRKSTSSTYYNDIIRFGEKNCALDLTVLFHKHENYDVTNGDITLREYKVAGAVATEAEHNAALAKFQDDIIDLESNAVGVFMWDAAAKAAGLDGLLAMATAALELANYIDPQ